MSQTSDQLMKQLHFILRASRYYMFQNKEPISGQKRVLAVLKLEDGLTQNYLAEILALKPGSLAELLKKMELKGDISREVDEQDKRVKRVYLTAAGKEKAAKLAELKDKQDTEPFFAGLTAEEQEQFGQYLQKIAAGWDEDFKEKATDFVDPAYRMERIKKWRKYAEDHDFSKSDMRDMCRHMYREHHYRHDFEPRDFTKNCYNYDKMHKYDRDFWRKFWHNENEEL